MFFAITAQLKWKKLLRKKNERDRTKKKKANKTELAQAVCNIVPKKNI